MKTFKLVSLAILLAEKPLTEIQLYDGLIINREDEDNHWMVEAFIDKKYVNVFEDSKQSNQQLNLLVTISKKSNDPAAFQAKVTSITVFDSQISVLLEGHLMNSKFDLAEMILSQLVDQGLQGNELLQTFKQRLTETRQHTSTQ